MTRGTGGRSSSRIRTAHRRGTRCAGPGCPRSGRCRRSRTCAWRSCSAGPPGRAPAPLRRTVAADPAGAAVACQPGPAVADAAAQEAAGGTRPEAAQGEAAHDDRRMAPAEPGPVTAATWDERGRDVAQVVDIERRRRREHAVDQFPPSAPPRLGAGLRRHSRLILPADDQPDLSVRERGDTS